MLFPVSLSQEVLLDPDDPDVDELNLFIISAVEGILAAGIYFWKAELVDGLRLAFGSSPDPLLPSPPPELLVVPEDVPNKSSCICLAADW